MTSASEHCENASSPKGTYLAVIPARGGSKRLPKKNVRFLGGIPLLVHSIKYAQASPFIDRVVVTTDDGPIRDIATQHGALVVQRPPHLATDTAKTGAAIRHVLHELAATGYQPDGVVTLQPTNPLRPPKLLQQALSLFENSGSDSVISVSLSKQKTGSIVSGCFHPQNYQVEERSQDLKKQHFENGLIYVTKPSVVHQNENVFGSVIQAIEVTAPYACVDIDEEVHFRIGEFLFQEYRNTFTWLDEPK